MENINFIPANELPVAEGNEVSVLCLENGEMKQKPASGLGGDNWDAVIHTTDYNSIDAFTLVSGTYEAIRTKVLAGEVPKIKATWTNTMEDGTIWHTVLSVVTVQACETIDDEWLWILLNDGNEQFWIALQADNTITTD